MTKHEYKPRIADQLLFEKLRGMGAVLIEGPKWCGKKCHLYAISILKSLFKEI